MGRLLISVNASSRISGNQHEFPLVQPKTDLDFDLKMGNLGISDMSTGFHDFEPIQVTQAFSGFCDGLLDGVVTAFGRRTDDFDDFIDMIVHFGSFAGYL